MLRVIDTIDKRLVNVPVPAVTVPDSASTLLVDQSALNRDAEWVYIEVQNVGANDLYINLDAGCDGNLNIVALIPTKQMYTLRVPCKCYGYSVGGTKVAITAIRRQSHALSNFS